MTRIETYDLQAELDRIDAEMDDIADQVADLEPGNPRRETLSRRGQQLEREFVGLQWALNPEPHEDRDSYESVTISELTAGKYLRAGSRAEADTAEIGEVNGTDTRRLYRVASAIEDADFVGEGSDFDDTFIAVGQVRPQFFTWLENRVDDLTTPEIEGNGFLQRVAASQSSTESASNTDE